jgi:hypothetical protein
MTFSLHGAQPGTLLSSEARARSPSSPRSTCPDLREWTANAERAFPYLAVCSDETAVGEDAVVSTSSELPEQGPAEAAP